MRAAALPDFSPPPPAPTLHACTRLRPAVAAEGVVKMGCILVCAAAVAVLFV